MKTFRAFVLEQDAGLGDMAGDTSANNEVLCKIARIAIDNHRKEIMHFFKHLSEKDNNIKNELDRFNREISGAGFQNDNKFVSDYERDKDQVVPSSADSIGGYN